MVFFFGGGPFWKIESKERASVQVPSPLVLRTGSGFPLFPPFDMRISRNHQK